MENYNIHFNEFATSGDVQAALDAGTLVKPYVALVDGEVDINGLDITPPDYENMPFTIEIKSAPASGSNIIRLEAYGEGKYIMDYPMCWDINGVYGGCVPGDEVKTLDIPVNVGDKVSFVSPYSLSFSGFRFVVPGEHIVYGNIMSLVYGTSFETAEKQLTVGAQFASLFSGDTQLFSAKNLILAATGTTRSGMSDVAYYESMFNGCTNLVEGPVIMYNYPSWAGVFNSMFSGCTSLNYVTHLHPIIGSYNNNYANWLAGVSPTGTFVQNAGSGWVAGEKGIPAGWTVVDA